MITLTAGNYTEKLAHSYITGKMVQSLKKYIKKFI